MIGALTWRGAPRATRSRNVARAGARARTTAPSRSPRMHTARRSRGATRRATSFRAIRTRAFPAGARLFVLSAGMLATAFLTALLYLRFATSIAASGYDLHEMEARRDELVRQNELLQLRIDRLDAPTRIEAEAERIGLVKASHALILTARQSVTLR